MQGLRHHRKIIIIVALVQTHKVTLNWSMALKHFFSDQNENGNIIMTFKWFLIILAIIFKISPLKIFGKLGSDFFQAVKINVYIQPGSLSLPVDKGQGWNPHAHPNNIPWLLSTYVRQYKIQTSSSVIFYDLGFTSKLSVRNHHVGYLKKRSDAKCLQNPSPTWMLPFRMINHETIQRISTIFWQRNGPKISCPINGGNMSRHNKNQP